MLVKYYIIVSPIYTYWNGSGWTQYASRAKRYTQEELPEHILNVPLNTDGSITEWAYIGADNTKYEIEESWL